MTLADQILTFQKNLNLAAKLPKGVEILNPYRDEQVTPLCETFYHRFYNDNKPRAVLIGINPGRHGGGLTGIPFTDPIQLDHLGIPNHLPKKPELSSTFIYTMVDAFGGPEKFYHHVYITSVSPLGFVKGGKNLNYYDEARLAKAVRPFILACFEEQLRWPLRRQKAFCLGEGDNYKFLRALNDERHWFEDIVPLAHPRFILQYRRKQTQAYVEKYVAALMHC